MTPTALETYTRQRFNAVSDNFFSQEEIFNYFYAAMTELALETFCIRSTYTTTSVASQRAYDFPTNTISLRRVEYDGERIFPNDFLQDDALTGNNPDETITGTPEHYQVWGDQLYLRPVPSTSSLTLKLYTYDLPVVPTSTNTLSVPTRYHLSLADYALYCMFAKNMNHQMADYHYKLWLEHKKRALQTERLRMVGDSYRMVADMEDLWDYPEFISG